ncbi:MAG: hypothetical protein RR619_07135 [Raoultibacter sp.]
MRYSAAKLGPIACILLGEALIVIISFAAVVAVSQPYMPPKSNLPKTSYQRVMDVPLLSEAQKAEARATGYASFMTRDGWRVEHISNLTDYIQE